MKILCQFVVLIFYYNVKQYELDKIKNNVANLLQLCAFTKKKKRKEKVSKSLKIEQTKTTVAKL